MEDKDHLFTIIDSNAEAEDPILENKTETSNEQDLCLVDDDISLYSITGTNKPCTKKLMGKILDNEVLILIYSGASSSFSS